MIKNVEYRAILFIIPKELWEFFFYNGNFLTKLVYTFNDILKHQFHNIKSKSVFLLIKI